ncbi:MAG: glycosyltransferase family 2 protein [Proteobacteria bacterium]|nr:glycosyltransferase family 2 protein [Pseudomonadota bacterium]MBU4259398.1 glycosyltransferase family 2 protein [Pseudomonadota bacterium]MBU4288193.1 glycosyltransferase family 2 protein [Pseudomonadota bacterium]MBU4415093.1 glycosyltransferase family 2 protein [Pseudomonadota bacterium]MCG2757758.1 glycosyltransferase family 2 protein [Desulfobacteraceae bacterium]
MNNNKTFSIVIPVYQNENNLNDTIPKLLSLGERIPNYNLELLFVDDGSTDSSLQILTQHAERLPEVVKIVKLTRNFGQTAAIQAGLRYANGDCVGIISADLQEPHEKFIDMIKEWEHGAMFVIGMRQEREEGKLHQMISGIYWRLVRKFALPDFPELGYDFCLLSRQVVDDINHINEKNSSIFVLIYWLGYKPLCLPIKRKIRKEGTSQWSLWRKIRFTCDTLIGFTYLPARLITYMGFIVSVLSVLYLSVMFLLWFFLKASPAGWMSVIGLLSLLGAAMLFSLGILSEYLLRILDESRKRPQYVVERFIENESHKSRDNS